MNADIFAEWLCRQGYWVVRTHSSYWYEITARIYQACPYHWLITPTPDELNQLLKRTRALGLRYSSKLNHTPGQVSYHVVYRASEYTLDSLPKKARYDVRKALKNVTVEPISLERLASEGWVVRQETLVRQGRTQAEEQQWWQKLCFSARGLPGFEAWGALDGGELVAALLAFTCDDCCTILYQQSRSEFLNLGVNNALTYQFTHQAMARPQVNSIFYGLHSLDAPASVDAYKFRMNFVAQPVCQRVVFNPAIRPFLNWLSYRLLKSVANNWLGSSTLSKAEGMVRFYLQGQRPLAQQTWPEVLLDQKEAILSQVG